MAKAQKSASPPPKNKGGRPVKIKLDDMVSGADGKPGSMSVRSILPRLGAIMCTTKEVAACLGVTEPTLFALFKRQPEARELYESGKLRGVASLRRSQFALAEKNATMAIFLGLNYAEQRDRRELTGANGTELLSGVVRFVIEAAPGMKTITQLPESPIAADA